MDLSRLHSVLDTVRLKDAKVTGIGAGGSAGWYCNLARCGVEDFTLVDPQTVEQVNLARQGHSVSQIGLPKVKAVETMLQAVNPAVRVTGIVGDFTKFTAEEISSRFGDSNLLLLGTDRFSAQAFGNRVALRLRVPAIFVGLYPSGQAGEVFFWKPGLPCYRCVCASRYRAHAKAFSENRSLDPASDGADIFAIQLIDAIAGMIALGLLTEGADNRYGRLIRQLGNRNFLQMKIDPAWNFQGRDVVRELLGVSEGCPHYFAWNTIARFDPDGGLPPCPDCVEFGNVAEGPIAGGV